jgi:L-serine deaminase|tara:strand:+ start:278 stop:502 length:225 start_codon:yes stop_codon:yes gene_type:complete
MSKAMEKYVAKALEGYETNYQSISEVIIQMEQQLVSYKEQQAEMLEGITEMKDVLGLEEEEETPEVVNDGTAVV